MSSLDHIFRLFVLVCFFDLSMDQVARQKGHSGIITLTHLISTWIKNSDEDCRLALQNTYVFRQTVLIYIYMKMKKKKAGRN